MREGYSSTVTSPYAPNEIAVFRTSVLYKLTDTSLHIYMYCTNLHISVAPADPSAVAAAVQLSHNSLSWPGCDVMA